jgi:MYXO-CTERM domain-containing protein
MFGLQAGWQVWLITFALLFALLGVGALARTRRRRPHGGLDPADEHEVAELFAHVDEEADQAALLVRVTDEIERLIARRTPLRAVRAAPRSGLVRLWFADSTVLVAGSLHPTELAALALVVADHHVVPVTYLAAADGVRLLVGWGTGTATLVVLGRDQSD